MAREGQEVDAERAHVDGAVRNELGGVGDDDGTRSVCRLDDGAEIVDRAQHVRHGRDPDEADAVDKPVELAQVEPVVLADGKVAELDPAFGGEHEPRHDVGVVLELGEQDRLALGKKVPTVGVSDEVERFGGVLREHDLGFRPRRVDEPAGGPPRHLELAGRLLCNGVDPAVHVRVGGLVVMVHRVEHGTGTLRRRRRVEIDKPLAVRFLLEEREFLAECRDFERAGFNGGGHERSSS